MGYDPLRSSYKIHHDNPYHMEHVQEFALMCDEKIRQAVPQMIETYCKNYLQAMLRDMVNQKVTEIWNDTVSRLVGAITYEIYTNVSIALENGTQILNDKKTAKRISDTICQRIMQEIGNIKPIKL